MPPSFNLIPGGVTAPKGFRASAVSAGIKNPAVRRLDLALIVSDYPTVTAAALTTNKVKAAPVRLCASHAKEVDIRAIVANSGNANACTGPQGIADAKAMTKAVAKEMVVRMRQVMVCSTGIIGMKMPTERIIAGIPELISSLRIDGSDDASKAIMTSDTKPKSYALEVEIGGKMVRIGGIAKGAGMICPSMATMLCFITTDALIDKGALQKAMLYAVEQSFNRISIDGDMSTNDTVIVMSNGQAGNPLITNCSAETMRFREALREVMLELAKMIVADGERVTKFVEIRVCGAPTYFDARKVAEAVAKSTLVKCSWNGSDPNWGRVMHAIGYSRARIREELVDIYFDGLAATRNGIAADTPFSELEKVAARPKFCVRIDLNLGSSEYCVYTSDLSEEYVGFNKSEYNAAKQSEVT